MDLDERKAAILKAVVEEHIHTAQPVGSQTIARSGGLQVSSATVRNEMTILEREGYLVQPHTSAGRIPTDLGYRFFVDHLTQQSALAPAQRRAVSIRKYEGSADRYVHSSSRKKMGALATRRAKLATPRWMSLIETPRECATAIAATQLPTLCRPTSNVSKRSRRSPL